jgi:hypothetical protein
MPQLQSPAIDAGDNAACAVVQIANKDQAGTTRPIDADHNGSATCDIGSIEAPECPDADNQFPCDYADTDDDNDGYTDEAEVGTLLCANTANDDSPDDVRINDGCPIVGSIGEFNVGDGCDDNINNDPLDDNIINDGCNIIGSWYEGQFHIGTGELDPCGQTGWPSDIFSTGASANKLTIQDVISFITAPRKLDKSPGETGFDSRWDLVPGRGILPKAININDVTALVNGTTGKPPMLGGNRAFDQFCPFAP